MKNYGTKKEMIDLSEKAILSKDQLFEIRKPTPPSQIDILEENGIKIKSVKPDFAKKKLNHVFGFNFNFTIISKEYFKDSNIIIIHGRLSIKISDNIIIREQFGECKTNNNNLGNAFKGAATNALKKCMAELGFFWDIYGDSQSLENTEIAPSQKISNDEKVQNKRLEAFLKKAKSLEEIEKISKQFEKGIGELKPIHKTAIEEYRFRIEKSTFDGVLELATLKRWNNYSFFN